MNSRFSQDKRQFVSNDSACTRRYSRMQGIAKSDNVQNAENRMADQHKVKQDKQSAKEEGPAAFLQRAPLPGSFIHRKHRTVGAHLANRRIAFTGSSAEICRASDAPLPNRRVTLTGSSARACRTAGLHLANRQLGLAESPAYIR